MADSDPLPSGRRGARALAVGTLTLALVAAVSAVLLAGPLGAGLAAHGPGPAVRGGVTAAAGETADGADGTVPPGTTVFDDEVPAVAKLDPRLLHALRRAATDAEVDGVEFLVNSGWRSAEHQARLLRDAVAEYGSESAAQRWVATPETSEHVSGDAVDLGIDAAWWLSVHGAAYGLCQIYANETWHYELRPGAAVDGCPAMYADASEDPRLRP